ncbi:MAG: hypothetical protein ACE5FR_14385 [Rhodospirillales bacterium]
MIAIRIIPLLTVASLVPAARGDVTFYLQREGSPDDTGFALFLQRLDRFQEQDFEGPAFEPDGLEVPRLAFGPIRLRLTRPFEPPLQPFIFSSDEFDAPGRFFHRSLVGGVALTITAEGGKRPRALGLWIFDDTKALDSAYLVEVTEANGAVSEIVLENEIGPNIHGHEIEGFVGAVSRKGIAEMRIIAIDPLTGRPQPDAFETDHWLVARKLAKAPPDSDDSADDSSGEENGSADDDSSDDASGDDSEHGAGGHGRNAFAHEPGTADGVGLAAIRARWRAGAGRQTASRARGPRSHTTIHRVPRLPVPLAP